MKIIALLMLISMAVANAIADPADANRCKDKDVEFGSTMRRATDATATEERGAEEMVKGRKASVRTVNDRDITEWEEEGLPTSTRQDGHLSEQRVDRTSRLHSCLIFSLSGSGLIFAILRYSQIGTHTQLKHSRTLFSKYRAKSITTRLQILTKSEASQQDNSAFDGPQSRPFQLQVFRSTNLKLNKFMPSCISPLALSSPCSVSTKQRRHLRSRLT
ncbi:hypothetical protein AC579_545 [Pseudocercospora musae]|uniref:Uncharacterized protein n=1 Tax=Pseudocercospora musae TaxID=113226 RepID=A0A139IRC6_9PEZI|nr:hypothetical protein AC579_545 [Pseudocercospora musae]